MNLDTLINQLEEIGDTEGRDLQIYLQFKDRPEDFEVNEVKYDDEHNCVSIEIVRT